MALSRKGDRCQKSAKTDYNRCNYSVSDTDDEKTGNRICVKNFEEAPSSVYAQPSCAAARCNGGAEEELATGIIVC
jgi:hypothetical protein